jgi:hypothetical protein
MTSFNHIRMVNGEEFSLAEWLGQPVHSVIEFAASAPVTKLRAFNYVRGGQVSSIGLDKRQASEQDTNLVKAQAMNQDEALLCFSMTVEVFGLTAITVAGGEGDFSGTVAPSPLLSATDLRRLERDAMLELFVGANIKKPQFEAPFVYYGQSIGATVNGPGDIGGAATLALDYGTMGRVTGMNQQMFDLPIYIGGFGDNARPGNAMTFFAQFSNAYGGVFSGLRQAVRLNIRCDGLKKRPA